MFVLPVFGRFFSFFGNLAGSLFIVWIVDETLLFQSGMPAGQNLKFCFENSISYVCLQWLQTGSDSPTVASKTDLPADTLKSFLVPSIMLLVLKGVNL